MPITIFCKAIQLLCPFCMVILFLPLSFPKANAVMNNRQQTIPTEKNLESHGIDRNANDPYEFDPDKDSKDIREEYERCVERLNVAAQYDSSGYVKSHLSELIDRQCQQKYSKTASRKDRKSQLITALSTFAKVSCQLSSKSFWQDIPPDNSVANKIAHCFLEQDFSASLKFKSLANGENIAGSATGLAMACTKALGFTCAPNFIAVGVSARFKSRLEIIDDDIKCRELNGFGAAATTVIVMPNTRACISIDGHSEAYFLNDRATSCYGGRFFHGCHPIPFD